MDRQIVYPGAIPLETDILGTNRDVLIAIGSLASALFGATTTANGLQAAPTSPPSMSVQVGSGQIYAASNVDDVAYSSLGTDTTHQTVKQGISLSPVSLACAAPSTAGYSVNYLIEAAFSEVDTDLVTLPYYNASDPTQAFDGPSNTGASQPTRRAGSVTITAKPGIAAATGSQATPAVDAGFIALCVVTVPYGATSITADMISPMSSAQIVPVGGILAAIKAITYATRAEAIAGTATNRIVSPDTLAQSVQSGAFFYAVAAGGANALTAALAPAPAAMTVGMEIVLKCASTNTGPATLNVNGFGAAAITLNGMALGGGAIKAGQLHALVWDGTAWQLKTPNTDGVISSSLGVNGYEIYSHGKIEQWGTLAIGSGSNTITTSLTWPIPFPNAFFNFVGNSDGPANSVWRPVVVDCTVPTKTGCVVNADTANSAQAIAAGRSIRWRANGN